MTVVAVLALLIQALVPPPPCRPRPAAAGVDNLNDRDYFVFHPFPRRTVLAELHYAY